MWRIIICLSLVLLEVSGLDENYSDLDCVGDDGVEGLCVEPLRCLSTNPYIKGLIYPLPCTMSDGRSGVCCTDCELVTNSSKAALDQGGGGFLWMTGEKAWDKCIEYAQMYASSALCHYNSRVHREASKLGCHFYYPTAVGATGGEDARRGEYPHMALLGYSETTSPSEWVCSGSLISERFILTAAHCLYSQNLGPVTEAAFGILKRSDPAEYWQRYKIKRATPHPEYRPPAKYHDIALLETMIPVVFASQAVVPACLPAHEKHVDYFAAPFEGITATGWGNLGFRRELADTLQKVSLVKFTDAECNNLYPPNSQLKRGINRSAQMCYGHRTKIRDTCKGDSGGALQIDTRHPTCMHTLIGVTSYGSECGFLGGAGVYTKVAAYLPWIESVVWP